MSLLETDMRCGECDEYTKRPGSRKGWCNIKRMLVDVRKKICFEKFNDVIKNAIQCYK